MPGVGEPGARFQLENIRYECSVNPAPHKYIHVLGQERALFSSSNSKSLFLTFQSLNPGQGHELVFHQITMPIIILVDSNGDMQVFTYLGLWVYMGVTNNFSDHTWKLAGHNLGSVHRYHSWQ